MRHFQSGSYFTACLNIRPTLSFEATVIVLAEALGIRFSPDQEGKYEEYPAYRAFALGLEIALLAPPPPNLDTREIRDNCFQLIIDTCADVSDGGADVDMSALIAAQLSSATELEMERSEVAST
ncbi:hypothetical protein JAB1_18770 [Janthinobacterium sp. MP5059B]|uniref:hypothetical protein n=1 Tax=Janthinobacterium sp. MP5059B TaxID=1766683 RepID=UPI0008739082|nr:hypothetical protein [Janthinobacterium sp. MP5059B]OEZ50759.1 hypothetical protein JAB1_18770 [Janthinobacterium sp. MP5059B]